MPRGVVLGLARALAVVFGVVTLTFVLLHLAPGDPVQRLLGPAATPAQVEAAHHAMGLDRSLASQFASWLGRAASGDFGTSIATGRTVGSLLAGRGATAILVILSAADLSLGVAMDRYKPAPTVVWPTAPRSPPWRSTRFPDTGSVSSW
jgi:peptide/nickel transport system permease protein